MSDAAAPPAPPLINPWIVATAVMCCTFMEVLDTTVVNVSLPHIAGNLSATIDESTWVLTSYLVANAIVLPMTGWLATYFGRKRLLMTSVAGFTIASLFCGLAPNLAILILFRVIQGATGGALQPISQAVLLEAFPPHERGKAMGFWGLGIVVAPILGPVLGGWLTDSYSWRWVFYINLPVGILSLVLTQMFLFDPSYLKRASARIDYRGIALLMLGIGALQILLDKGQEEDWFASGWMTLLAIVSAAALLLFVIDELRVEHPVIDLRVFKVRTYATGVFLMTMLGFGLYGSLVLIPIMLQTLLGYPALQAGLAMAPRGLGAFFGMPVAGQLTGRLDPRKLISVGLLSTAATMFWLSQLSLEAGYWNIFWPQLIQGLSMSMVFVPLTTVSMDPIPRERMGNATSLYNVMRNIGGSVGIAVTGTLLVRRRQMYAAIMGAHVTPYDATARAIIEATRRRFLARGADAVTAMQRALAAVAGTLQRQAAMVAFVGIFRLMGVIFLAILPLLMLMRRPRPHQPVEGGAG